MKPHPRIRKTIKWGGAVVTVVLVMVWIGSCRTSYSWHLPVAVFADDWSVFCGAVVATTYTKDKQAIADWGTDEPLCPSPEFANTWWFRCTKGSMATDFAVPIWLLAVITLLLTISAWRLDTLARRRARIGFCPKCNYDRTGLAVGAVCPECGVGPVGGSVSAKS